MSESRDQLNGLEPSGSVLSDTLRVAAGTTQPTYNNLPPFHPGERYPELPFDDVSPSPNPAYALLRRLWLDLGLDAEHAETSQWNPFGCCIQPGDTVLLKPNYVLNWNECGGDVFAVITHPSILRALVDYAYVALRGRGRIIIADAPDTSCQWEPLMQAQRLDSIQAFYRDTLGFNLEFFDLRNFAILDPRQPGYNSNRVVRPGDPKGHTLINLGRRSAFYGLPSDNYYGADYDRTETIRHHQGEVHEYSISNTFLQADVVISAPKMKVHKKVGVTLNLKGLVGINTNKNCLIHYRVGSPKQNGDQLPDGLGGGDRLHVSVQRWLFDHALAHRTRAGDAVYATCRGLYRTFVKPFRQVSHELTMFDGGNWHGNDSAWRMTSDLAKILFFADRSGALQRVPQRRVFCVVDGIIAGEKEGPLAPTPKPAGCIVTGHNPLAVDMVTTRLMGFDFHRLKQFSGLLASDWDFGFKDPEHIRVSMNSKVVPTAAFFAPDWNCPVVPFAPHPGWVGTVEISNAQAQPS